MPLRSLLPSLRYFGERGRQVLSSGILLSVFTSESFAFETTLSGRSYLKLVQRLRQEGWRVELIYLALPSAEMSRQRVAHGGHAIDDADVARRFPRSLFNLLNDYAGAVDSTLCYLNTGAAPELVFEQQQGQVRRIHHTELFAHLMHKAGL